MDLNHVTLTGVLERDPITRCADHGTQEVRFTLRLTEAGPAGQAFTRYVGGGLPESPWRKRGWPKCCARMSWLLQLL